MGREKCAWLATLWVVCACCATSARADRVAAFDGLAEGTNSRTLVDPASGITFTAATSQSGVFVIEFAGTTPQLPTITAGNVLGSNGYVPGAGVGFVPNFGFTATLPSALPSAAGEVALDVLYSLFGGPAHSFSITGYDADGGVVASQSFDLPIDQQLPGVARLQLRSAADDIRSFKVMTSGLSVLYDNVRFVPEPSAAMGILCLASLSLAGRRARR